MAKSVFNNVRIQLKNDTAANWKNSTLVLLPGEFAVENDTGLFKIGNGTNVFNDLKYANQAGETSQELEDLKSQIGEIPEGKTIIQMIEEAAASGGSVTWDDIENKPTKVSVFENDANYLTEQSLSDYATKTDLDAKQDKLTAGNNITIVDGVISAIGGSGGSSAVESVNGKTGAVTIAASDLIESSSAANKVSIAEDGTLEVNSITFDKILQSEEDEIILSGGGA